MTEIEPDNVWPQCKRCNQFKGGDPIVYRLRLIQKIGKDRVERLENLVAAYIGNADVPLSREDKLKLITKRTGAEYERLAVQFRAECRKLEKEKL